MLVQGFREWLIDVWIDFKLLFKKSKKPVPLEEQESNPAPEPLLIEPPVEIRRWQNQWPNDWETNDSYVPMDVLAEIFESNRPPIPNLEEMCISCGATDEELYEDKLGLNICKPCMKRERKYGRFAL